METTYSDIYALLEQDPVSYTHLDVYKRQRLVFVICPGYHCIFSCPSRLSAAAMARHECYVFYYTQDVVL